MNNEINAKVEQYKDITSLDLKNLPKVKIIAKDGATTTIVKVSGDPKSVNGVNIQNSDGNLIITGPDYGNDIRITSSGGTISVGNNSVSVGRGGVFIGGNVRAGSFISTGDVIFNGQNMHVGGRVIINGVDVTDQVNTQVNTRTSKKEETSELSIELIVPERIKLAMESVLLSQVEGIIGRTRITVSGVEEHVLKSVAQIKAKVSGQGKIEIGKVEGGKNKTNVSGQGCIIVNSGKMEDLSASVSGRGDIVINAEVVDADLDVSGTGNISVSKVTGDLLKNVSGMGRISVGNRR